MAGMTAAFCNISATNQRASDKSAAIVHIKETQLRLLDQPSHANDMPWHICHASGTLDQFSLCGLAYNS